MQVNEKTSSRKKSQTKGQATEEASLVADIAAKSAARKPAKKSRRRATTKSVKIIVNGEDRVRLIAEAAYFTAEFRGFAGGDTVRDWLEAEAQIDSMYRVKD